MENKVCKGKLFVNGTCYANGRCYVGDVYFLADDLNKLDVLLSKDNFGECFNPERIHLPALLAGPLEFCKAPDIRFIYKLSVGVNSYDHPSLKMLGAEQETIYEGGEIQELLTKDNRFFTSKLIDKPVHSFKVKAISEMERIEKLLKEADLQLSPEQEVKLLRKIVEEQQTIINNLKGI
ncbi:hypothetical protein PQC65_gp106 [Aeromonas phage pAEv1810]|uniref:hypothetical protein n=1 Tax=Aeromonas phage pAEv1810 TaxID=2908744 RepID=UPI0023298009|nr:hypothetical protein PQC65_gp106 [Aeromonas phage pAEv1810]UIS25044.1 hypothetical protein pAEv1810_106 [Aeromonas phage pAEv1810]